MDVTREEFDRVIDILNERGVMLDDIRHNLSIQFQRIAQLQAQLDQTLAKTEALMADLTPLRSRLGPRWGNST